MWQGQAEGLDEELVGLRLAAVLEQLLHLVDVRLHSDESRCTH